jgi:hypothetical protein
MLSWANQDMDGDPHVTASGLHESPLADDPTWVDKPTPSGLAMGSKFRMTQDGVSM